ncbi:MAG TPA: UbiA family prenyltransferase [Terriglobales bacterium]|nr:UbiA family prenyltransferase [Terriglobales bacterium]
MADGGHHESRPVLCVDLDGTLVKADLLWECLLALLKRKPLHLVLLPLWLLRGKASLKRSLALRFDLNVASLPYRSEMLEFLRAERQSGRRIVLVTAADERLAQSVADHLGLFDRVCASDGEQNLKGRQKAEFLERLFGKGGFEYVGDSSADLEVWRGARAAYVAGGARLASRAAQVTEVKRVFPPQRVSLGTWVRALRGHHWFKNLLLFLPLALAHRWSALQWMRTAVGFLLFGVCASGLYILNDLLDLHSDRSHPWKSKRPFAAGEISIPGGLAMSLLLLASALGFSLLLGVKFALVLLAYAVLTMGYSLQLKKIVLLDVFILSSFYSVRILAGAQIASVPLSQWFLPFSMFFFLSLAMAKRYSELVNAEQLVESGNSGRGYITGDKDVLLSLGVASSFAAIVIFSLYVHSPEVVVLYHNPAPLLLLCPIILYWLSRVWLQAHRGELHEDPVTLAIRDPVSYAVAAACIVVILASMMKSG